MRVRVFYRDRCGDLCEYEYFSKFNRINAKGIKSEIFHQLCLHFGRGNTIDSFYRLDD